MVVLFWVDGSSSSILFKDSMILHQSKIKMQHQQFVPKIGHVQYSNKPEIQQLLERYQIKEYPTLILFDQHANPYKTVIGFSWFETPNLYALQKMMITKKNLADLGMYCTHEGCGEKMVAS